MSNQVVPSNDIEAKDLLEINSEHRLRSENLPFDIDVWYPSLQQFTFPSKFIPLTRTEAQAIMNYQEARFNERNKLTSADVVTLNNLEMRVDVAIKQWFGPSGAFLRLCGRSPKDAEPLNRDTVYHNYQIQLQKLLDAGAPLNANTKLQAVSKVSWLSVTSGKEAMSLLLTSERVFADLHDWIKWGEPEQIVLRQWEPELSLEYEFRGFVHQGKLNAISQYDHYCVYPELTHLKDTIQEKIIEFWQVVHPHVGVDTYIVDFGFLPQSNYVVLIEISPFLTCTGPAMFSWKNDRHTLENGPFEFRLNATARPHIEELVEANWEMRWQGNVPKYWEFYHLADKQQQVVKSSPSSYLPSLPTLLSLIASTAAVFAHLKTNTPYNNLLLPLVLTSSIGVMSYQNIMKRQGKPKTHILFVYGTLKKNFHWHMKFMSTSQFLSEATTVDVYPLVVGGSGVPYLLGDLPGQGKHIRGELWRVDDVTLQGLDEYEGISKGYYIRKVIATKDSHSKTVKANVYFKTESSATLRELPMHTEYTLQYHKEHYKAIEHIMVKQQLYMKDELYISDPSTTK